jgi:hypothetical protein
MKRHIISIEDFKDFHSSILMAADSKSNKKLLMVNKPTCLYPEGEYVIHYQIHIGQVLIDEGYDLKEAINAYNML